MPRESAIVDQLLKFLNGLPSSLFRKKHGTVMGFSGDPDLYGCLQGRMVLIEVKQMGKRPTTLQTRRLLEWERAGAVSFWTSSLEQVKERLKAEGLYAGPVFDLGSSESALWPKEGGSGEGV